MFACMGGGRKAEKFCRGWEREDSDCVVIIIIILYLYRSPVSANESCYQYGTCRKTSPKDKKKKKKITIISN